MDIISLLFNVLALSIGSTVISVNTAENQSELPLEMPVIYGLYSTETVVTPKPKQQSIVTLNVPIIPENQESCYVYTEKYAGIYNLDKTLLDRIIRAESGGNPLAKNPNSSASGCAQFIASTWSGTRSQMGKEWVSPFNAEANVEAMAWKIANGGLSAWNASRSKWAY